MSAASLAGTTLAANGFGCRGRGRSGPRACVCVNRQARAAGIGWARAAHLRSPSMMF